MIVVDMETTGVNPQKCSVLSIGAVDFSNPNIKFYGECHMWGDAHVDPEALAVNGFGEIEIRDPKKPTEGELVAAFLDWLNEREERTLAGHNPHFDAGFLHAAAHRNHINIGIAHRTIDQHTMAYYHMIRLGLTPPVEHHHSGLNSDAIMEYVGIPTEPKPHNALNGALWEAEAFHRLMFDKSFLAQFAQYPVPWSKKGQVS